MCRVLCSAYFLGYNWAKSTLTAHSELPAPIIPMVAGFFADVAAAPLWIPMEVVTSRLQIQGPGVVKYDSARHAFSHILHNEGYRGLFRGMGTQIFAFGPASALWWATYEASEAYLKAHFGALAAKRRAPPAWLGGNSMTPRSLTNATTTTTTPSSLGGAAAAAWSSSSPSSHSQSVQAAAAAAGAPSAAPPTSPPPFESLSAGIQSLIHGVSGMAAGVLTAVVTNPLDIAKTRLQTQHSLLVEYSASGGVAAAQSPENVAHRERLEREAATREARKTHFFTHIRANRERGDQRERLQRAGAGAAAHQPVDTYLLPSAL